MLGYDVAPEGGRLVVNEEEAGRVRTIFSIVGEAATLAAALGQVREQGLTTKAWTSRGGREHAGRSFTLASLRALLSNVLYRGSIRHKGTVYPGEQPRAPAGAHQA